MRSYASKLLTYELLDLLITYVLSQRKTELGSTLYSMLEALFGDDAASDDLRHGEQGSGGGGSSITRPAAPRNATKLSGLSNLGATCYLNSLLQTLHFTPEFRGGCREGGRESTNAAA